LRFPQGGLAQHVHEAHNDPGQSGANGSAWG
jgi:hypothetical protein